MRVNCAACSQPIAPVDEPLMLRVEGEAPGGRMAFHARCWVWWSEARRLERTGARLGAVQLPAVETMEPEGVPWTAPARYQFPDSER